jgi:hypothetical protein
VKDFLTSIEAREATTDDSYYDDYEQDEFGLSRLLVEIKLGEPLKESILGGKRNYELRLS